MSKEIPFPTVDIEFLANELTTAFIQRRDLYARQLDDGSYICIHSPLEPWLVKAHLEGELTLGTYLLDQESQARFVVLDADDDTQFVRLVGIAENLYDRGVNTYLEGSRRGGHLWSFFEEPIPGQDARTFGKGLMKAFDLDGLELYPKQTCLKDGPGSLIRLPFGVHRKSGQRYGFFQASGESLALTPANQLRVLSSPCKVPKTVFSAFRELGTWIPQKAVVVNPIPVEGALSEQIKARISVVNLVSQYVDLGSNGRGLCPFHDDHHASFSVHPGQNYWHCFAGCGGGSVIDFWMKWQDCDFKTAVKELAGVLL